MFRKTAKYLTTAILLLSSASAALQAQNIFDYENVFEFQNVRIDSTMIKLAKMTVDDYMNIKIPSLEELYENSRNASSVKAVEAQADTYYRELLGVKRKPLAWLSLYANYSYGNMDMAAISLMQTTYAVWSQNSSSQTNNYYSVGASFSVSLYDIINQKNQVKLAEAKLRELQYRMEAEHDLKKQQIISLYCDITQNMRKLGEVYEGLILAKTQYEFSESEFVANRLPLTELFTRKNYLSNTNSEFENIKRVLNQALLELEIISCTPIVANYELLDDGD